MMNKYSYFRWFTVTNHELIYNVKYAITRIPLRSATSGQSEIEEQRKIEWKLIEVQLEIQNRLNRNGLKRKYKID